MKSLLEKARQHYFLFLIVIFAAILLSVNLNKPFIGHHDWNGAWYSNFARNYLRYGYWQTKFGQVLTVDYTRAENFALGPQSEAQRTRTASFAYNTHYPPTLPILISVSFRTFGVREWSARLVPALSSLATIAAIYIIGVKFFNLKTAIFSSAISTVLPITIYFGKMPVHEVIVLPFVLLNVILYFNYYQKQNLKNFLLLIATLTVTHLIHWSAYFVTPIFFAHYLIASQNPRRLLFASSFILLSILMFFLYLMYTFWLTGSVAGGGLFDILLDRLNVTDKPADYTIANFTKQRISLVNAYFSPLVIILSTIPVLKITKSLIAAKLTLKLQLLAILAVFGASYNVIFRNAAFYHDYTVIYFWPFLALAAGYGFFLILQKLKLTSFWLTFFLTISLLTAIFFSRLKFTVALLYSDHLSTGVWLGKLINQNSASGEKTLVLSPDFKSYFEVPTAYYADRAIEYELPGQQLLEQEIGKYRLIVAIPSRGTPANLLDILQQRYKATKINEFVIFDTKNGGKKSISFRNHSSL